MKWAIKYSRWVKIKHLRPYKRQYVIQAQGKRRECERSQLLAEHCQSPSGRRGTPWLKIRKKKSYIVKTYPKFYNNIYHGRKPQKHRLRGKYETFSDFFVRLVRIRFLIYEFLCFYLLFV